MGRGGAGRSGPRRGKKRPPGCGTRRLLSLRGPEVSRPLPASGRPPGSRDRRREGWARAGEPPAGLLHAELGSSRGPGAAWRPSQALYPLRSDPFSAGSESSSKKACHLCTALSLSTDRGFCNHSSPRLHRPCRTNFSRLDLFGSKALTFSHSLLVVWAS